MSSIAGERNKSDNKKELKIRTQILISVLPIAIIPLIVIVLIVTNRMFLHLEKQSKRYYSTLINQVSNNLEFVYAQYGRTLANMMDNPDVLSGLNAPPYKNKQDEINVSLRIIGDENIKGGLRNTIEEKIEGAVFIYELDRKSIIDKTDYKVHFVSSDNALPNFERFINDPLFLTLKNNNSIKLIAGKLSPGTIVGFESDKKPAIIFPYYPAPPENESDSFSKFILVTLFPDFIPHFYEDIADLKFGTLYILDRNDNILTRNHPNSSEDYYDYDEKQKKYNLGDDIFYDEDEGMSFYEYSLLNTDEKILTIDSVKSVLGNINEENIEKINSEKIYTIFNNTKYLTVAGYGEETKFKFIYFHPLGQIRKPIYDVIKIIVIITVAIIVLLLFTAFFFSKKLTDPIINLSKAADQITDGDYNIKVDASGNKEITLLSEAFNKMTMEIRNYTDNLEKTVEKRTGELKEANEKLKIAHEALWGEMELAKKIQTSLLPVEIDIPDYDISAIMISANEVGGDFYDVVNINGRNFIAIGDVSGHGVTPGLIMMMAHTAIRAIIIQNPDISCSKLYKSLNTALLHNIEKLKEDKYMTMTIFREENPGEFKICGKHQDIIIYRYESNRIEIVETKGVWLAMTENIDNFLVEDTIKLNQNDLMLLYTDGFTEAKHSSGILFEGALNDLLLKYARLPTAEILNNFIEDLKKFTDKQDDDITVMIVKKK